MWLTSFRVPVASPVRSEGRASPHASLTSRTAPRATSPGGAFGEASSVMFAGGSFLAPCSRRPALRSRRLGIAPAPCAAETSPWVSPTCLSLTVFVSSRATLAWTLPLSCSTCFTLRAFLGFWRTHMRARCGGTPAWNSFTAIRLLLLSLRTFASSTGPGENVPDFCVATSTPITSAGLLRDVGGQVACVRLLGFGTSC